MGFVSRPYLVRQIGDGDWIEMPAADAEAAAVAWANEQDDIEGECLWVEVVLDNDRDAIRIFELDVIHDPECIATEIT